MDQQAWIDQQRAHITETIRTSGWAIQYIGGDTCARPGCQHPPDDLPPFAYTVGLFGLAHPELLIIGVDPVTAATVLNRLGEQVRDGEPLMPGTILEFEDWGRRIVPEPVPNPGDIALWANDYYRRPPEHSVPLLQLTYDDQEERFPWDDGYADTGLQPRPGTFIA